MKFTKFLLLLLFSQGFSTEYAPWFPTLFEFQGRASYLYEKVDKVDSPKGNFYAPSNNSSLQCSLDVTPWPYWSAEAEVYLTHTSDIAFAYEAALFTLRYAWLDDLYDWAALVTGVTLSFPGERFLHQFSFAYHGNVNVEAHATLGKEWSYGEEWVVRIWTLGGYGIANRGNPWVHGIAVVECAPSPCIASGLVLEAVYGLGNKNIIPHMPFEGYASINHQSVDIGGFIDYDIQYFGTLTLFGWYNIHARNFIDHSWGAGISLLVPFGLPY